MVEDSAGSASLTDKAVEGIRSMIARHALLPGSKLRQAELADLIGVSRSPLREALRSLEAQGLVEYEAQRGYVVRRLLPDELRQLYRMREILETEILRAQGQPTQRQLATLRSYNAQIAKAGVDAETILRANRDFHFAIFDFVPMNLFSREVARLWDLSEQYRAAYLMLPDTRQRIVSEHKAMIDALAAHDIPALVAIADKHRHAAEVTVAAWLGVSPSTRDA